MVYASNAINTTTNNTIPDISKNVMLQVLLINGKGGPDDVKGKLRFAAKM